MAIIPELNNFWAFQHQLTIQREQYQHVGIWHRQHFYLHLMDCGFSPDSCFFFQGQVGLLYDIHELQQLPVEIDNQLIHVPEKVWFQACYSYNISFKGYTSKVSDSVVTVGSRKMLIITWSHGIHAFPVGRLLYHISSMRFSKCIWGLSIFPSTFFRHS